MQTRWGAYSTLPDYRGLLRGREGKLRKWQGRKWKGWEGSKRGREEDKGWRKNEEWRFTRTSLRRAPALLWRVECASSPCLQGKPLCMSNNKSLRPDCQHCRCCSRWYQDFH